MTSISDLKTWEEKASWARTRRDASLAKVEPKLDGIPDADSLPLSSQELPKDVLTPREIEITEKYTVTELLRVLRERELSVEEVTRAFLRRAALAQAAVRAPHDLKRREEAYTDCLADQLPYGASVGRGDHTGEISGFSDGASRSVVRSANFRKGTARHGWSRCHIIGIVCGVGRQEAWIKHTPRYLLERGMCLLCQDNTAPSHHAPGNYQQHLRENCQPLQP